MGVRVIRVVDESFWSLAEDGPVIERIRRTGNSRRYILIMRDRNLVLLYYYVVAKQLEWCFNGDLVIHRYS